MIERQPIATWLTDMDGVLVHEEHAIPGAREFIAALREHGRPFVVLTNNSIFIPRDLAARLSACGPPLWPRRASSGSSVRAVPHS